MSPAVFSTAHGLGGLPLTQEETGASPLITPFGVNCLEKLGDALLKNGESVLAEKRQRQPATSRLVTCP